MRRDGEAANLVLFSLQTRLQSCERELAKALLEVNGLVHAIEDEQLIRLGKIRQPQPRKENGS